ncbi:MAG TPA: isocitrate lyase/PEP mutase family protein [Stellaceae bacterium]|nr:isocitrate lyase/PEP mutase family protein [Stellaceae bacterium]
MSVENKALRTHLHKGAGLLVPGAANAVTARLIEELGFAAAYVTGAGVANSFLGAPDIGLITLTELAQQVAAMRENVRLPLIVDADTGFGNAVNTARAVKVLERAGANAIQLEDQVFPKRCGHFAGKQVIPAAEMAIKVKAACEARHDADFIVIARTDALAVNGIDDALERAARYIDAGADVTFVEAPRTVAEMERITALPAPQLVNLVAGGLTPMLPREELARMGFAIVLYANAALQAAMQAMKTVLRHLGTTGALDGVAEMLMDFNERQAIVGKPRYDAMERRYAL